MTKEHKLIAVAVAAVLAIPILFSSFTIVEPGHRGVAVRLGKVDPEVKPEGLNFKTPFIEKIVEVPIQQRTVAGNTDCFSSDLQIVQVAYSVMYRLPEGKVVELFQQFKGDPFDSLVKPRLEEQLKQITSAYKSENLVKNREVVKVAVIEKLKKELAGLIDIQDVNIVNLDLSDLLEASIEKKQVFEQESLQKVYQLETARKESEIVIIKAKAEAESIQIAGQALKDNPGVVELKIVEKWDGKSPQVYSTNGQVNPVLPLVK